MWRIRWFSALLLSLGLSTCAVGLRTSLAEDAGSKVALYLQGLARVRGVPVPGHPTIVIRSKEETRKLLVAGLDRGLPPEWWESEEKALRKFALIPPDLRVKETLADLLSEMIVAYFDFERQELVLQRPPSSTEDEMILIHELVHLLQSSLFDAKAFLTLGPGRGDEALARRAVLEGEAQALMLDFLLASKGQDITKLPNLAALGRASLPPMPPGAQAIPRALRDQLLFPYIYGLEFVRQFRLRQPWTDFSRIYHDPPRATAQILYPDRYFLFRRDPPPVRLPDFSRVLGDGWRLIKDDDLGALGMIMVLQVFLDESRARRVAETWDGDRYQIYQDRAGRLALILFSTWRIPWKAIDFATTYEELLKKKYPGLAGDATPGAVRVFRARDEVVTVEQQTRHVLITEGLSRDRAAAVREALWPALPGR